MPFNDLWGVGREPQSRGAISEEGYQANSWSPSTSPETIFTKTLTANNRIVGIKVNFVQDNNYVSNAPVLTLFFNGEEVMKYTLNPNLFVTGDIQSYTVRDYISMNKIIMPGDTLSAVMTYSGGGGSDGMNFRPIDIKAVLVSY
jgi:hypothetical protein